MDSSAALKRSPDPTNFIHLQSSFSKLSELVSEVIPQESQEKLFPVCLGMLEEALASVRVATGMLNAVTAQANMSILQSTSKDSIGSAMDFNEAQPAESTDQSRLGLDFGAIEQLLNATVASCMEVRRLIHDQASNGSMINSNDEFRDGAPL